jgi:hypothetical protein
MTCPFAFLRLLGIPSRFMESLGAHQRFLRLLRHLLMVDEKIRVPAPITLPGGRILYQAPTPQQRARTVLLDNPGISLRRLAAMANVSHGAAQKAKARLHREQQ